MIGKIIMFSLTTTKVIMAKPRKVFLIVEKPTMIKLTMNKIIMEKVMIIKLIMVKPTRNLK